MNTALNNLLGTLQSITSRPGLLDSKLAEYAFVPVSQVLRISQQVPVRALEICLECISALLCAGWGGELEPALSGQLLILFTFLAKPSSAGSGIAATSEELQSLAFKCMAELLDETSRTNRGKDSITATANIPSLGEAVLVMLDGLVDSNASAVKASALNSVRAVVNAIVDNDALASFLPRMVSSLTKVLTPSSSNRPSFRIVIQGLDILSLLFSRLLSDRTTKDLPETVSPELSANSTKVSRSKAWLQATASQIKVALANVFKLRNHDKLEVRQSLLRLCLNIVQNCRMSLSDCTGMAIETAISLAGREDEDAIENELRLVLSGDEQLADILRESLHGWVVSLPRLMQSKDDYGRRQIIHQISVSLRLFEEEPIIIDDRLAGSLRDGVGAVLADSKGLEELTDPQLETTLDQSLMLASSKPASFQPLKLRLKGQDDMMGEFIHLIREIAKSSSALTVLQNLTQNINFGTREMRLASFWVSVNLLRDLMTTTVSFDDLIDLGTPNLREELLDDLYSQSVIMLSQREPDADRSWHFYALALETVALQASRYKSEYRAELNEVLYPVLHYLGHSNDALRSHALTCLNAISNECGYQNAGELVVANVDYIVNAVGLKLAIGDVSPQAPQVLLMMMRLCGPNLLPYLDDLVGSIFDALERYHGYPKLTELLFSVLKGMAEEGVKAPQLAITAGENKNAETGKKAITIANVVETMRKMALEAHRREKAEDEDANVSFPKEPWKETSTRPSAMEDYSTEERQPDADTQTQESVPPAPRTYDILLKISGLTQHYLTTESSGLRASLLSLLQTVIPALAKHENSFLPLINTLWPVLVPRLQDQEAFIVSNALDTITLLCEHAEGFMRSRIENIWDDLKKVYRRTKQRDYQRTNKRSPALTLGALEHIETGIGKLSVSKHSQTDNIRPELYVDAPTRMIWNSLVSLLCAISKHVTVRDEQFDEILDILNPVLESAAVREALDVCNADAVWLRLYKKDQVRSIGNAASMITEKASTSCGKVPAGRSHWHFIRI